MTIGRIWAISTLGLAAIIGNGCEGESARRERISHDILNYMVQPHFTGNDFCLHVTGADVQLERYYVDRGIIYFSASQNECNLESLSRMVGVPKNIKFARETEKGLVLDGLVYYGRDRCFFGVPDKDFSVNPDKIINIPFSKVNYTISLAELSDFIGNKSICGGKLDVIEKEFPGGYVGIANHGALIAKPNEPSLTRFANKISEKSRTPEEISQVLLDFVSREIDYGGGDDIRNGEVLKRPNEVLFTRASDCSGKAILYASLLMQKGIDFKLAYFVGKRGHISVLVEGTFPNRNGLSCQIEGRNYAIAESTTEGFIIGDTKINLDIDEISFIQDPGKNKPLMDIRTGKFLKFR